MKRRRTDGEKCDVKCWSPTQHYCTVASVVQWSYLCRLQSTCLQGQHFPACQPRSPPHIVHYDIIPDDEAQTTKYKSDFHPKLSRAW